MSTQFKTETRTALLEATGRLMHRLGYAKTSVEEIAQEAGLSRATAYLYFPNKKALVMEWLTERGRQLLTELSQVAPEARPWERLHQTLRARVLLRLQRAQRYGPNLEELLSAVRVALNQRREAQREEEARLFSALLSQADPALPDPLQVSRLLLLATEGLLPHNLSALELAQPQSLEGRLEALCQLLIRGLRGGP